MKIFALAISSLFLLAPLNAALAGIKGPPVQVPEPSTLALIALGVAGALVASRMRNKK